MDVSSSGCKDLTIIVGYNWNAEKTQYKLIMIFFCHKFFVLRKIKRNGKYRQQRKGESLYLGIEHPTTVKQKYKI